jgi:hypothetical protein
VERRIEVGKDDLGFGTDAFDGGQGQTRSVAELFTVGNDEIGTELLDLLSEAEPW